MTENNVSYEYQPQTLVQEPDEAFRLLSAKVPNPIRRGWVPGTDADVIGRLSNDFRAGSFRVTDISYSPEQYARYYDSAEYSTRHSAYYPTNVIEKSFEHFIVCELLKPGPQDVFIDIASEESPLPEIIQRLSGAQAFAQDIMFPPGIHGYQIGGDACRMPVEDGFASLAALTCSLEHFEADADIRLFSELGRVLCPGGRVCIVPLYLFPEPATQTDPRYSAACDVPFDRDATVYCSDGWGNRHGRFYSVNTLKERIIEPHRDTFSFRVYRIVETQLISPQIYARWVLLAEKT